MKAAKILALLAVVFLCVSLGLAVLDVSRTVTMLPSVVHREADLTRDLLDRQLKAAQHTVAQEIEHVRHDANRHISVLTSEVLDARIVALQEIGNLRAEIGGQLTTANRTIADETAALNRSVATLAAVSPPIAATAQQIADAAPLWLDCDHNADCIFNRWVGTSRGIEKMALALGANAAPQQEAFTGIARNVAGITEDVHKATTEFTRPRTARERAWAIIRAASGIAILAWR